MLGSLAAWPLTAEHGGASGAIVAGAEWGQTEILGPASRMSRSSRKDVWYWTYSHAPWTWRDSCKGRLQKDVIDRVGRVARVARAAENAAPHLRLMDDAEAKIPVRKRPGDQLEGQNSRSRRRRLPMRANRCSGWVRAKAILAGLRGSTARSLPHAISGTAAKTAR